MDIRVLSYNCRGLRLGSSAADKARRLVVDNLLVNCDILCLQETFLAQQDLHKLNSFNDYFHGAGESTTDYNRGIVRGRISGGVAILWRKALDRSIKVIRLGVDWCIGVQLTCDNKDFVILNVYTPYECRQNEDEYLNKLAFLHSFVESCSSSSVYVVGDMNADITDLNSAFGKYMVQFCTDHNYILSSKVLLPNDSYTYISEALHTTSWLDHCITTSDAHASLGSMEILYSMVTGDHIPISFLVKVEQLPVLSISNNTASQGKLDWSALSKEELMSCFMKTDIIEQC